MEITKQIKNDTLGIETEFKLDTIIKGIQVINNEFEIITEEVINLRKED